MQKTITLTAILLLSSCADKDIPINTEGMEFEYIASSSVLNDCPEDGCGDGLELSMCAFASNLGTLAILENIGELEIYQDERRCGSSVGRFSVRARVLEHISGDKLEDEITLHSNAVRGFNSEGSIALIQLHNFEDKHRLISFLPISRESFIETERDSEFMVGQEQVLPNTLTALKEEASRIASAPEECTDFPRRTEQFWNDVYHGVCTD